MRRGRKTGVFLNWEDCKQQVMGFSGASYKSFPTLEEAQAFVRGESPPAQTAGAQAVPLPGEAGCFSGETARSSKEQASAYVDGSFDVRTGRFGCGVVFFHGGEKQCLFRGYDDAALREMRNVAGEIKGAEWAMRLCAEKGIRDLILYHDYEGIAKWCTGEWKANKEGTRAYRDFYRSLQGKVNVTFQKVKGHSGDRYNEEADRLAKMGSGILPPEEEKEEK